MQLYHCTSHSDQWGNWGMARLNGAFEIAHCITKEPRQLKQIPCNRNAQFGIVRATMHCNGSEPMFQRFDLHVYYCAHHYYRIITASVCFPPPPVFHLHQYSTHTIFVPFATPFAQNSNLAPLVKSNNWKLSEAPVKN